METDAQFMYAVLFLFGIFLSIGITYFFLRWVFSVDKMVKQNDEIIQLLKELKRLA